MPAVETGNTRFEGRGPQLSLIAIASAVCISSRKSSVGLCGAEFAAIAQVSADGARLRSAWSRAAGAHRMAKIPGGAAGDSRWRREHKCWSDGVSSQRVGTSTYNSDGSSSQALETAPTTVTEPLRRLLATQPPSVTVGPVSGSEISVYCDSRQRDSSMLIPSD